MKKKIIPIVLVLIIGSGIFLWYRARENGLVLKGEVEGTTYSQIAEVPGKIVEMKIALGSPVRAGDLIARIDNTDQKYALEQLQINLEKGQLSLNSLRDDIKHLQSVLKAGGVTQNELDKTILQKTITEADIREMESQIRQMQDTLKKFEIKASCDGIVISLNYNLGSMVNPGYNIADISAANEKYVVCYVPVDTSEQISYNDSFFVRANKKECRGEVRFIDVKSQYTPKDMQTSANKNKVSVKVKLLLPPETDFKPGSFVDVVIKQ